MGLNIIGVLGCGGYIGKYATEKLLRLGFQVLGAQRNRVTYFEGFKNYSFTHIDVTDTVQLEEFIKKCDIVVNCVSPSHLYGKIVKDAVCKQDKIYIDPSDMSFEKEEGKVNGKCVTSCGYIPGIAEFLPYIVSCKHFDKIKRTVVYQGGFDGCSPGAFVDMILGAANKNLFGDSYILHGNICPLSINIRKTYETPFSENKVIFKPLINRDTVRLQKKTGSEQQYFFCAYDNMETLRFFMKLLIEVSRHEPYIAAENIKRKLYERIENDKTFGKEEVGAYLFFELIGERAGYEKCISGKLFLKNVNRLCGNLLGEVVNEIAMNPGKVMHGLNYGFEILNPEYFEKISTELEKGEYIKINEISIKNKMPIEKFIK